MPPTRSRPEQRLPSFSRLCDPGPENILAHSGREGMRWWPSSSQRTVGSSALRRGANRRQPLPEPRPTRACSHQHLLPARERHRLDVNLATASVFQEESVEVVPQGRVHGDDSLGDVDRGVKRRAGPTERPWGQIRLGPDTKRHTPHHRRRRLSAWSSPTAELLRKQPPSVEVPREVAGFVDVSVLPCRDQGFLPHRQATSFPALSSWRHR